MADFGVFDDLVPRQADPFADLVPLQPPTAQPGESAMRSKVRRDLEAERAKPQTKPGLLPSFMYPLLGMEQPRETAEETANRRTVEAGEQIIGQGIPFSDEVAAGILGLTRGRGYDYEKERQNLLIEEARRELGPGAAFGLEGVGGLATGVGAARAGLTFAPRLMNAPWWRRALGRAGDSAALGALYGGAGGTSAGERATNAVAGGALGGLLGLPAPSVVTGGLLGTGAGYLAGDGDPAAMAGGALGGALLGPQVARSGGLLARSMFNPADVAGEAVASRLAAHGRTLPDVELGMRRAGRDQYAGTWTLGDETADETRSLFSGVAQAPSATRDQAYRQMLDRQAGQGERLVGELGHLSGERRTAAALERDLDAARRAENNINFPQARAEAGRLDVRPVVNAIDEQITLQPASTGGPGVENRVSQILNTVFDQYPPPTAQSTGYYREAYNRGLLSEIEEGFADGLDTEGVLRRVRDNLDFLPADEHPNLVLAVRRELQIPSPREVDFDRWRIDALDRITWQRSQEEAQRGLAREAVEGPVSGVPNDRIASTLRQVRRMLTQPGRSVEDFGHAWRVRENLSDILDSRGLSQPTMPGQQPRYNSLGRILVIVRQQLDEVMSNAAPSYREALRRGAAGHRAIEAIGRGREAAGSNRQLENIRAYREIGQTGDTRGLPPAQVVQRQGEAQQRQASFRTGYIDRLIEQIEAGTSRNQLSKVTSAKRRAELAAIAPTRARANRFDRVRDREQTMVDQFQYIFGGSPTARRFAEQDAAPELIQPEILGALLTGNPGAAARNLMSRGSLYRQGLTPEVRDEVIRMLMTRGSGREMQGVSDQLRRSVMGAEARRRTQDILLRGLYGAGASGAQ